MINIYHLRMKSRLVDRQKTLIFVIEILIERITYSIRRIGLNGN